jgi:23S rRNA (cytosine1962-C5)-methyltransferase
MSYPILRLKPRCDRRLVAGHQWIYSNEVDTAATPLKGIAPGQPVVVQSAAGEALGVATCNPANLICGRLLSRDPAELLDAGFFRRRLRAALALRTRLFDEPFYRLVFGEADRLSGLVVDRFDDVLVAQLSSSGMDQCREPIVAALLEVLRPAAIVLKNDSLARQAEGLELQVEAAYGACPERVAVRENGCRFEVSVTGGQKTGWFYDHRDARAALARYCRGARVLDVFSYVGGWGIQAANAGAQSVLCVDSSADALALAAHNAALNGCADRLSTRQGQAAQVLADLAAEGAEFDVVVLDPPAFIKRRKDLGPGTAAYRKLNQQALRLLAPGGTLATASCSMHLPRASLVDLVARAAARLGRHAVITEQFGQSRDHPVVPAIPETEYLKTLFVQVATADAGK